MDIGLNNTTRSSDAAERARDADVGAYNPSPLSNVSPAVYNLRPLNSTDRYVGVVWASGPRVVF